MEFSSEITESIKALSIATDKNLELIVEEFDQSIPDVFSKTSSNHLVHSLLRSIFVECAKLNTTPSQLKEFLFEYDLSDHKSNIITKSYQENKQKLQKILSRTSIAKKRIVDVQWSLHYVLRNSYSGKVNEVMYNVNLITKGVDGEMGCVQMICSSVQIDDLLSKLQEANKQIDKLTAS